MIQFETQILFFNDKNEEVGERLIDGNVITKVVWHPFQNEIVIGNEIGVVMIYNPLTSELK